MTRGIDRHNGTKLVGRREFVALIAASAFRPRAAHAQAAQPKLIGVLYPAAEEVSHANLAAFRARLGELGYREGSDYQLAIRYAAPSDHAALLVAGQELLALAPAVILTATDPAVLVLRQLTSSVPVVFAAISDPVTLGLAQSFPHPGGNMTGGVSAGSSAILGKQLALLKELAPTTATVAALYQTWELYVTSDGLAASGAKLGLTVRPYPVVRKEDVLSALTPQANAPDAYYFGNTPLFNGMREEIVALVAKSGRPAMYTFRDIVDAGGLASYGASISGRYRDAADYVAKILTGAAPGDLPIQQPNTYELVINLKTAKTLGLIVPPTLLARADAVIE